MIEFVPNYNTLPSEVECKYDPVRDAQEVEQHLAVNVDDMLRTGIVKDSGESLDNNGIDDPNNIIGIVRDEFAAIDAQRAIKKYGKKPAAQAAAVESAASVSSPKPSE